MHGPGTKVGRHHVAGVGIEFKHVDSLIGAQKDERPDD